jgi:hypothetical protein
LSLGGAVIIAPAWRAEDQGSNPARVSLIE